MKEEAIKYFIKFIFETELYIPQTGFYDDYIEINDQYAIDFLNIILGYDIQTHFNGFSTVQQKGNSLKKYIIQGIQISNIDSDGLDNVIHGNFGFNGSVYFKGLSDPFMLMGLLKNFKLNDVTANNMNDDEVYIVNKFKFVKSSTVETIRTERGTGLNITYKYRNEL